MRNAIPSHPPKKVLTSPAEFYEALLAGVRQARHRVVLASLYIGTGHREAALVRLVHAGDF
jgi:hypothetical protein